MYSIQQFEEIIVYPFVFLCFFYQYNEGECFVVIVCVNIMFDHQFKYRICSNELAQIPQRANQYNRFQRRVKCETRLTVFYANQQFCIIFSTYNAFQAYKLAVIWIVICSAKRRDVVRQLRQNSNLSIIYSVLFLASNRVGGTCFIRDPFKFDYLLCDRP